MNAKDAKQIKNIFTCVPSRLRQLPTLLAHRTLLSDFPVPSVALPADSVTVIGPIMCGAAIVTWSVGTTALRDYQERRNQ